MNDANLEREADKFRIPTIEQSADGTVRLGRDYIIERLVARDNALFNRWVSVVSLVIAVAALVVSAVK